ncbi:MAG: hypothetical protein DRG59_11920, partial [Deltaproteobacteria bacterium]
MLFVFLFLITLTTAEDNTCSIPEVLINNYNIGCSCNITYTSNSGSYFVENTSVVVFPPNFESGVVTFICDDFTVQKNYSSVSELLVDYGNLSIFQQSSGFVEWKQDIILNNRANADYKACVNLSIPVGSFDVRVLDKSDGEIVNYTGCYNHVVPSQTTKILSVYFKTNLSVNITGLKTLVSNVVPLDSFEKDIPDELYSEAEATIIVYQNSSLTYTDINVPKLSSKVIVTKEFFDKNSNSYLEQKLNLSEYSITNTTVILRKVDPGIKYIVREIPKYKILGCDNTIILDKPVLWNCRIEFNNKIYNISYKTPKIKKHEIINKSECGWLVNVTLKTDSTTPYTNFDILIETPNSSFGVEPKIDFYTEIGTNKTRFKIPLLNKTFNFLIFNGCYSNSSLTGYNASVGLPPTEETKKGREENKTEEAVGRVANESKKLNELANLVFNKTNLKQLKPELNKTTNKTANKVLSINTTNKTVTKIEQLKNLTILQLKQNTAMISLKSVKIHKQNRLNLKLLLDNKSLGKANISIRIPKRVPENVELYVWKRISSEGVKKPKYIQLPYSLKAGANYSELELILHDGLIDDDRKLNGEIIINNSIIFFVPDFNVSVNKSQNNKRARIVIKDITSGKNGEEKNLDLTTNKGTIGSVKIVAPENTINTPNKNFNYKLLKFRIENLSLGETVSITLNFDELPKHPKLLKFNPNTGVWYNYPFEIINETALKIRIQDGGFGDDDGLANGVIIDDLGITDNWWNTSWSWRKIINITNTAGNLTEYQVLVVLNSSNFNFSRAKTNGSDIRFTYYNSTSDSEYEIPYWIDYFNASDEEAYIWVKVPFIENNTITKIIMYYGNN